ncbi:helix-turn-helix domain-containing protein [Streptomyces sp. NPDC006655]|uniref:helix-turn-helix domain-containing protein n=1 Tax=Streptomyces sp. NPDC006655 TaxID=3156898 RepID=UPI00345574E4
MRSTPSVTKYMDMRETAKYLGVSVSWLYKNAKRYGIPAYRFGVGSNSKIRFEVSEVESWVRQQRVDHW